MAAPFVLVFVLTFPRVIATESAFLYVMSHLGPIITMVHAEQHKIVLELRDYTHKMKRQHLEEFEMFEKRDKDDEDLDQISKKRLVDLYNLYVPAKRRMEI